MTKSGAGRPEFIVALGGSAGGLDAFEKVFANTPPDTGMAYVVVTHMDPHHEALLPQLLQRVTTMPVKQIEDRTRLAANTIHVIPPNHEVVVEENLLRLRARRRSRRTPIDLLFQSLAHERGANVVGVIVSGMDADGAAGVVAIKEAGGRVVVQEPATAAFDAMPRAAIAAVTVDAVVAPEAIPARIAALLGLPSKQPERSDHDAEIDRVLETLRQRTGHDLSQYKRTSIHRRIERRLAVHGIELGGYADYLVENPEEAELLLRELLIGVTQFFREEPAFIVLRDQVLPALVAVKHDLRAWVAGCSTGEEAYSLAIVIHEVLAAAKRTDVTVKIYATDLDKESIAVARAGHYSAEIEQQMSADRLAQNFVRDDHGYRIRKEIRDSIVFAEHDLIADPPFTRIDILCCRNVLIYLQPVLQQKLFPRFHYALGHEGVLVLGPSETVSSATELFSPIDSQANVFRRLDVVLGNRRTVELPDVPRVPIPSRASSELTVVEAARRAIVETIAPPTVVINDRGDVLYASRRTGRFLEPAVGKTNINIFAMAREGLAPHLSLAIRQAIAKARTIAFTDLKVRGERGANTIDLTVIPMTEPASLRGLLLVVFADSPARTTKAKSKATTKTGKRSNAERELERMKTHLQSIVREMEAAHAQNEATNEELQSANEELQSTNEEVTTSKEELQSMNEELLTLNAELNAKNSELVTANDDLRNLLNSTKIPTVFLDNSLRIKRFTNDATRIANLIPSDVGRAITDIALKVDYPFLARDVEGVLGTLVFKEVQVLANDGASISVRIHPYRTTDNMIDGVVLTFFDVTALRRAEQALLLRTHDDMITRLLDRWPGIVYIHDVEAGRDVYLNDAARRWLQAATAGHAQESQFASLLHSGDAASAASSLGDGLVSERPIRLRDATGGYVAFRARESVLTRTQAGAPIRILAIIEAVSP